MGVEMADPSYRPDVKSSSLAAAAVGPAFLSLAEKTNGRRYVTCTVQVGLGPLHSTGPWVRSRSVIDRLILATATGQLVTFT